MSSSKESEGEEAEWGGAQARNGGAAGAGSGSDSDSSSDEDDTPLSSLLAKANKRPAPSKAKGKAKAKPKSRLKKGRKAEASSSSSEDDDEDEDESEYESEGGAETESEPEDDGDEDFEMSDSDAAQKKRRLKKGKEPAAKRAKKGEAAKAKKPAKKAKAKSKRGGKADTVGTAKMHSPDGYDVVVDKKPLVPEKTAYKWWNDKAKRKPGVKWTTLVHNAVLFPPAYEPHGVKMLYDGKPVDLTPEQEEVATWYAVMLETDYVKDPTFNKNFFADWRKLLGRDHVVRELSKCDFGPIKRWADAERDRKKEEGKNPEVRKRRKADKDEEKAIYGYALVDGQQQQVGNYRVEPPGLFRGRGKHPKTGKIKRRVFPEQVVLNIGKGVPIPACPMPGHNWKGVIHNPGVTWLAYWRDNINGDFKYVFLAANSRFKGESDLKKYEKARALKKRVDTIRRDYRKKMRDKTELVRQLSTALYLIDVLALRVGNEKDTSEVADTVGCCSLRVEHLSFPGGRRVVFDFLGKDSMRYHNDVEVEQDVYDNLKAFCTGKAPSRDVFDRVSTSALNAHLSDQMPGLTAKVFRTFNASVTLQKCLFEPERDISVEAVVSEKKLFYDLANKEVAILCNHQRTPPKTFDAQMEKLDAKIAKVKRERRELKAMLDELTGKKQPKKEKKAANGGDDGAFKRPNTTDPKKVKQQIAKRDLMIKNYENDKKNREENKQIALGTSKINYMDPRITVAWCKHRQVPIEKIFSKSLLDKFPWAMEVGPDFRF